MDLKGSTSSGLKLSTRKLDRFNLALVNQLSPYLRSVQLDHALVKFTGDGWLVMSDEQEDAPRLCCLAMIMAKRFAKDMALETGFQADNVPAMRLALCWGRDLPVTLHGGQRDFVGGSVRHAVRACQLCDDNEILIDETVRTWITHDFVTSRCDMDARLNLHPTAKMEEELVLHTLEELKLESADDRDAPICYVNALAIIGRANEADHLANLISEHLVSEAVASQLSEDELRSRWNDLLSSNLDHDRARDVLSDLMRSGLKPNVGTYNALIERGDDFTSESRWLHAMIEEGIRPELTTFNVAIQKARNEDEIEQRLLEMSKHAILPDVETLKIVIPKAPSYEAALKWQASMARLGVRMDQGAFEGMIAISPDFETAKYWLQEMMANDIEPAENAFIQTFSKGILHISGDDLLKWYLGLKYHPTHPIKRAIAEYRKAGKVEDALRLSLDYPHTDTALKTMRQHPEKALHYFRSVVEDNPKHANGAYALGMAMLEIGNHEEAAPWLRQAYQLASPGTRKDELARYLSLLGRVVATMN